MEDVVLDGQSAQGVLAPLQGNHAVRLRMQCAAASDAAGAAPGKLPPIKGFQLNKHSDLEQMKAMQVEAGQRIRPLPTTKKPRADAGTGEGHVAALAQPPLCARSVSRECGRCGVGCGAVRGLCCAWCTKARTLSHLAPWLITHVL